jgi:hypothetical protein
MSPVPSNKQMYNAVKNEAKKKFRKWPSAYASGWVVKEYKRRGGKYVGKRSTKSGLSRWFLEKWVNICTSPVKPCGRPTSKLSDWKKNYPYCRPSKRVTKSTPKTVSELDQKEVRRRCSKKRRNPQKRIYGL